MQRRPRHDAARIGRAWPVRSRCDDERRSRRGAPLAALGVSPLDSGSTRLGLNNDAPMQRGDDRLDSWKAIAAYLRRGLRTVRRWEKEEGLPVHRHVHQRLGSVYAYKSELDVWRDSRGAPLRRELVPENKLPEPKRLPTPAVRRGLWIAAAVVVTAATALAAYGILRPGVEPLASADRVMLAVLPFENLSATSAQEFFSDGLTEELITELGRLNPERLGVIARTSAMQYKGTTKGADEIARDLGVDYLVEGSVRHDGDRVRISAQLIRASDQTHLWAESYDRASQDFLSIQTGVARTVATKIRVQLSDAPTVRPRVGTEAYEAYLRGRYHLEHRTAESISTARRWFERAVALEPRYASAYVGIADSHILAVTYAEAAPAESMQRARQAVETALEIDERLPEAHAWLGIILTEYDWNWTRAEQAFRRAIELDPNFAYAHKLYAEYLSYVGNFDAALAEARLARRLDPLSVVTNSMLGFVLYRARRYEEALEPLEEALELSPDHALPHLGIALAYSQLGRHDAAIAALETARSLSPGNSELIAQLGYAFARAGRVEEAQRLLVELETRAESRYVAPFHFAIVYAGLGDVARAVDWLEQSFRDRLWLMCVVKTDAIFDPLRSDERFQTLVRRLDFPSHP
jgi:TolB-like protein/Tfp pilus assembly protein PilF